MLLFAEPRATEPFAAVLKTVVRLSTSTTSPTFVLVPWASTRPQVAGSSPAFSQARAIASCWPIGFGAVMPLPLPSEEPPRPRTTAYTRSPSRSASASRFSRKTAEPSPITKPSAPSPNGRVPVAESAPIFENFTNEFVPMLRSTPPVSTASQWPATSMSTAASTAANVDAHAASAVKFGPRRFSTFATRPERMFDSSPGIVSSVMSGRPLRTTSDHRERIVSRTAGGRSRNSFVSFSRRRYSGNEMRSVVR